MGKAISWGAGLAAAMLLAAPGQAVAQRAVPGAAGAPRDPFPSTYRAPDIAVANGLPYAESLRAVTVNPHAIWGEAGGTLTASADADLVVWDGDPLEPSTNALAMIVAGRQVSTRSRQDLLAERYKDVR